jgi:hypothetical protein
MFPIIVPFLSTNKDRETREADSPIIMERLCNYTDISVDEFVTKAKKKFKDNSRNMGLIESIEYVKTLFAFDTCKESRRVSLVNFVLNTNIKGPSLFARIFKGA